VLRSDVDQDRHVELVGTTALSYREAELYLLKTDEGMTLEEAADEMGITEGTVAGKWGRVKDKIREAETTAELPL